MESVILGLLSIVKIDSDLLMILDSSTSTPDLSSISSTIPGAVMVANIDHPPYKTGGYKLLLSGYSTFVWVSVSSRNMGRMLRLLDSSIEQNSTRIKPGVWNKMNQFIFQVADQDSVEAVLEHPYASSHPHSFTAIQKPKYLEITPSKSSQRPPFKMINRDLTEKLVTDLLMAPTVMKDQTFRIGCLPYSHHARARNTETVDDIVTYSGWWGYEPMMVEVIGEKYGFSWVYDPPADGEWGAVQESGNMSGLIGQAAYGSVDWVMSGVMETRDRWLVADNPVSFDSDYMVFVSPAPAEISKATSPIKPFTQTMWLLVIMTVLVFAGSLVIMATITQKMGKGEDDDWMHFSNCAWFSFSTFIGESVMRYEAGIDSGVIKIIVGSWYLYALVATASYAGEIRSFFINPGVAPALDNLREVVDSNLPWGLILYGEEEEKFLEASTDPVLSAIWKGKEEVPLDETYAVLERVAAGKMVFIDYKNGVIPQIEIKYTKGNKILIHTASQRWTKFSGIGWYFNKFFPHTEMFESFIRRSIEAGLTDAWKKKTWRGMREEYLNSRIGNGKPAIAAMEDGGVSALVMEDLQGSFYFLFLGLSISTMVYIILVIKAKITNRKNQINVIHVIPFE